MQVRWSFDWMYRCLRPYKLNVFIFSRSLEAKPMNSARNEIIFWFLFFVYDVNRIGSSLVQTIRLTNNWLRLSSVCYCRRGRMFRSLSKVQILRDSDERLHTEITKQKSKRNERKKSILCLGRTLFWLRFSICKQIKWKSFDKLRFDYVKLNYFFLIFSAAVSMHSFVKTIWNEFVIVKCNRIIRSTIKSETNNVYWKRLQFHESRCCIP